MSLYKNILVPTDFSDRCSDAAQRARTLAKLSNGTITLMHVIDYLPPRYVAVELPKELASEEYMIEKAKEHMDEWANKNGLSDCEKIVETGHPKHAVVNHAEKMAADVVVLAPSVASKLERLFGSVTNSVSQSVKCDVLIVRNAEK